MNAALQALSLTFVCTCLPDSFNHSRRIRKVSLVVGQASSLPPQGILPE